MGFEDQSGKLRRKFPRRAFRRNIGFLCQGNYQLVMTEEIGEGGIAVVFNEALPEKAELLVTLRIPGGDFLSLRGMIRSIRPRSDGFLYGIAFTNISFTHKRQIRAYVSSRAQTESAI